MKHPPKKLQGILWSSPVEMLDLDEHKEYIIHQVLMYGTFDDLKWLFKAYSKAQIKSTFIKNPRKVYSKPGFHYTKNFLLNLNKHQIPAEKYVNSLY